MTKPRIPLEDKVVAVNPSKSTPGLDHWVCIGEDLNIYCTCPCWTKGTYKGRRNGKLPPAERECGHTEGYKGIKS
jgi:hypothetical protein